MMATFYKDDIKRAKYLSEKGIHYVDVGTSVDDVGGRAGRRPACGADRVDHTFGGKLLSAMRFGFDDHVEMPQ